MPLPFTGYQYDLKKQRNKYHCSDSTAKNCDTISD